MDSKNAKNIEDKIIEIQSLMIAFVTDERSSMQSYMYINQYLELALDLENAKYENPNPHKSLETFYSFCRMSEMVTYASRRAYVSGLYTDILLDLKRIQRGMPHSKNWEKANDELVDELAPIRMQWLKAKNFIYAAVPDFENSIKESINSVESCLKVLLNQPKGTMGKMIKQANLDPDIERIAAHAYGAISNKDFVRHGGTISSNLTKEEAEFFLDFSAATISYITKKSKGTKQEH